MKRNRSLAYLKTKHYNAALSDTSFPDFGEEASEKALFRAAETLYNLTRYEECCNVLEKVCDLFPTNKEARN
jgi:TolA-binding protein